MNSRSTVEKVSEIKRNISVQVPYEEYSSLFNVALQNTASRARVKGFRPGHAPKALVAKMYEGQIQQDVMQKVVSEAYRAAVQEHALRVVGNPELVLDEYKDGGELTFTAKVDVFPEPTIKEHLGLAFEVEVENESPGEEEIEAQLKQMLEQQASLEPIEGRSVVEKGDIVLVDFVGTVENAEFPGSKGNDAHVDIGSGDLPKEFEEGMIGTAVGETRTVSFALPEGVRDPELVGKPAEYAVTVKALNKKILPELNDDFALKSGLGETVSAMREKLREQLASHSKEHNERNRRSKLFEVLAEKNQFEVPQAMIDEEIREILFELNALDRRREESYQVDVSPYRNNVGKGAEFRARRYVMLEALVKQENVEVSDEELNQWVEKRAAETKTAKKELEVAFGLPKNAEQVKKMVARERISELLLEKAKIKEKVVPCGHNH